MRPLVLCEVSAHNVSATLYQICVFIQGIFITSNNFLKMLSSIYFLLISSMNSLAD